MWFYNHADGDCGLRSNFGAMTAAMTKTASTWEDPFTAGLLRNIGKRRRIEGILAQMPEELQRALFLSFGPNRMPPQVTEVLGYQIAPVALLCLPPEVEDLWALCSRMVRGSATEKDTSLINRIRIGALDLRRNALAAYVAIDAKTPKKKHRFDDNKEDP